MKILSFLLIMPSLVFSQSIIQQEDMLEKVVISPYEYNFAETIEPLIDLKMELGKEDEAIVLYEEIIGNIRITRGIEHIAQIPYILKMTELYFINEQFTDADDWLDLGTHIQRRDYNKDNNPNKIINGYYDIIMQRFGKNPTEHKCFYVTDEKIEYDNHSGYCKQYRLDRIGHLIKATQLQEEAVTILEHTFTDKELLLRGLEGYHALITITQYVIYFLRDNIKFNINRFSEMEAEIPVREYDIRYYSSVLRGINKRIEQVKLEINND